MIRLWKKRGLSLWLWPLSILYQALVKIRNRRFDSNQNEFTQLNARVVSIGNITVGGTGKTPLVMAVTELLQGAGHRVAILTRGYARNGKIPSVVTDGNHIQMSAAEAGDEPFMMAHRLSNVPVIVGANRSQTGQIAMDRFHPDTIILDDGFQHRQVARDVDVVTLDATHPFGNGWPLPAGPLREPLSALKRADLIVLTRTDQIDDPEPIIQTIRRRTEAPILTAVHQPLDWIRLDTEEILPLDYLRNRFCLGFCGVGNPDSFEMTVRSTGIERLKTIPFRDHHVFTMRDYKRIDRAAEKFGAVALVTTEKDGARLGQKRRTRLPVYALRIALKFSEKREAITKLLT